MSENVRKCHSAETHLSEKQWIAIELMPLGPKVGDMALAVGVDPRTVLAGGGMRGSASSGAIAEQSLANSGDRLVGSVESALDVLRRQLFDRHERLCFRAANAIWQNCKRRLDATNSRTGEAHDENGRGHPTTKPTGQRGVCNHFGLFFFSRKMQSCENCWPSIWFCS
jgi:hypothetical protein